jgi:N-formylglutamate deformylase
MALLLASAHLADDEFLDAFHACRLSNSDFRHADHLRLAWLHLHKTTLEAALANVRTGIRNFANFHGTPHLYHETLTTAWVRLLATHHEKSFEEFLSRNEQRLTKELLHQFWTPELLASDQAKKSWVAPDRKHLPEQHTGR